MSVTDYYHLVDEYETRYNIDCLSYEYIVAYEKSIGVEKQERYIRFCLRNAAIDQIRKKKYLTNFTDYLQVKQDFGSSEEFLGAESRQVKLEERNPCHEDTSLDFYDAVECMSCFDKKVLDLRLLNHKSKDIATLLEVEKHAVDNALRRLQMQFRAIYQLDT